MSSDSTGSVNVTVVTKEQNPSFLNDELQLSKLSKLLSKVSKEAVEVLVSMLSSEDESIRMRAASKLIEYDIDVKKAMSTDQLQRLVAEIKLNRQSQENLIPLKQDTGREDRPKPIVDFSVIKQV